MDAPELVSIESVLAYLPEIVLCGVIVALLLLNVIGIKKAEFYVVIAGLVVQLFFVDANVFKITMGAAAIITILLSGSQQRTEFYVLITAVLLGASLLVTSTSFIIILLSMETISLSSYVLTSGTDQDKRRAEAAWKFFIYGSVATAVMVFGMSYYFGASGSISFTEVSQKSVLISIGGIMILGGFLFKMTAAPFHLWAPDVYQATPAPIVAFLSVVPKLAAISVILKAVASLGFTNIIAAAALLSIIVGTLAALSQADAKRMMAYSSVAQAGIMLSAIAAGAIPALIFYAIVFAIMNYAVFIVIDLKKETAFTEFSGLGYSNPFATIAVTLALVSLVGIPPVAGFMAKLFVFTGVWSQYNATGGLSYLALFVTGLLATVASLFFYLKIPFYGFFRKAEGKEPIKISLLSNLLLIILVGLLLALFVAPGLADGLGY